jgi:hypothetical protein
VVELDDTAGPLIALLSHDGGDGKWIREIADRTDAMSDCNARNGAIAALAAAWA